jgi:hypothetical protein
MAAEGDLAIDLSVSRQDLQNDANVRIGTAPHVDVTRAGMRGRM